MYQGSAALSLDECWENPEPSDEESYGRSLYNRYRYYDPSLGRYVSADPIGQLFDYRAPEIQMAIAAGALADPEPAAQDLNHLYNYAGLNPLLAFDPSGLGQTTNLGGGTTVRIDQPKHGGPGQTHAHVKTPKGPVVVNQDGSQSHGSKGSLDNLNKKAKKFLRSKGFRIPGLVPFFIIFDPCVTDPYGLLCPNRPPNQCGGQL